MFIHKTELKVRKKEEEEIDGKEQVKALGFLFN
jgi:hypothetical protein